MIRVVVGILNQDTKLLVTQRPPHKPYSGYWEFPGGKIEPGESSEAALARELHEEIGIDVLTSTFLFAHQHTYPDKTVSLEIWLVKQFVGEPHGKENQCLRWVTLTEMKDLHLLAGNWLIYDKLKTIFKE